MARKYIVGGKVYLETGARKVIVGGKVLLEATQANSYVGGGAVGEGNNNNDITIDFTAHEFGALALNDFALAFGRSDANGGAVVLGGMSGWTILDDRTVTATGRDRQEKVWWKFLSASESNPTMTTDTTDEHSLSIHVWRGIDPVTPFDVVFSGASHFQETADDSTPINKAITTANAGSVLVLTQGSTNDDITVVGLPATPTGLLEGDESIIGGDNHNGFVLAYKLDAGPAATITPTAWTHTASPSNVQDTSCYTIALRADTGASAFTLTFDAANYEPGDTIQATVSPAMSGNITKLTFANGDIITAEGGASTTVANFIPLLSMFENTSALKKTRWNTLLTATVTDDTDVSQTDTLTIDTPTPNNSAEDDDWLITSDGTDIGDDPINSIAPVGTDSGDDVYLQQTSGTGDILDFNVKSIATLGAAGGQGSVRRYGVSAAIWSTIVVHPFTVDSYSRLVGPNNLVGNTIMVGGGVVG